MGRLGMPDNWAGWIAMEDPPSGQQARAEKSNLREAPGPALGGAYHC